MSVTPKIFGVGFKSVQSTGIRSLAYKSSRFSQALVGNYVCVRRPYDHRLWHIPACVQMTYFGVVDI